MSPLECVWHQRDTPLYDPHADPAGTAHASQCPPVTRPGIGALQGPHIGMHGQRPLTAHAPEGAGRVPTPDPRNPE